MCNETNSQNERALGAEASALLEKLVARSSTVFYCCKVSEDCGTIFVSDNVHAVLGYHASEFIADPGFWAVRVHAEDSGRVFERFSQLFQNGELTLEYRLQHANGTFRWIRDEMKLDRDAEGNPARILGSWLDITEQRELEQSQRFNEQRYRKLAQNAEQLRTEALVSMTRSLAHQLNNALGVIRANVEFPEFDGTDDPSQKAICTAADELDRTVRDLLAFSRQDPHRAEIVSLEGVLRVLANDVASILGDDIALELNLKEQVFVALDLASFRLALAAITQNARDAMPNGGCALITSEIVRLDENSSELRSGFRPGEYMRLRFADTGCGIATENLARLFEPFFSTRRGRKGMGMAVVSGIIHQHRGWIDVASRVGNGTTFSIYLPAQPKPQFPTQLPPSLKEFNCRRGCGNL